MEKYLQLYENLRKRIVDGDYPCGRKMPSKRILADEYGVSLITCEHALALLNDEGYIRSEERKGSTVIYQSEDFMTPQEEETQTVRHPILGSAPFPYRTAVKTMRKVLSEHGEEMLRRKETWGCLELRTALSRYLNTSRHMPAEPDQIVIAAGSEDLYGLLVQVLGRDVIYGIEDPCYEKIAAIYAAQGVKTDHLKMGRHGILTKELQRTAAMVLHVTPFSSYPSGITADATKRSTYIAWAEKRNAVIIEDDYASEFDPYMGRMETLFSLSPDKHVIYSNSFTRTIGPGVRTSYMVLPKDSCEAMKEKIRDRSCPVPVFEQLTLAELLNNGSFERNLNRERRRLRKERS